MMQWNGLRRAWLNVLCMNNTMFKTKTYSVLCSVKEWRRYSEEGLEEERSGRAGDGEIIVL